MCKWGTWKAVHVKIPADLSSTGQERWKWEQIDACIADLVAALQAGGVDMRGSCCGHGEDVGHITLQDGRMLVVTDHVFAHHPLRWGWRMFWRGVCLWVRGLWNQVSARSVDRWRYGGKL